MNLGDKNPIVEKEFEANKGDKEEPKKKSAYEVEKRAFAGVLWSFAKNIENLESTTIDCDERVCKTTYGVFVVQENGSRELETLEWSKKK